MKKFKKLLSLVFALILICGYIFVDLGSNEQYSGDEDPGTNIEEEQELPDEDAGGKQESEESSGESDKASEKAAISESGSYTSKDDVALYIHTYGHLPDNFITKSEAKKLGWEGGSLEDYAPGKCIGGDRFGNNEELLPKNHKYYECDIDTLGADSRGEKRIVYSTDGLIYYTGDHYESFQLLYGEE